MKSCNNCLWHENNLPVTKHLDTMCWSHEKLCTSWKPIADKVARKWSDVAEEHANRIKEKDKGQKLHEKMMREGQFEIIIKEK